MAYITTDTKWEAKDCPKCGQAANSHGWLFNEQPPQNPRDDQRKCVGEVFVHEAAIEDCVLFGNPHEHDYAVPKEKAGVPGYECACGAFQPLGLSRS